MITPPPVIGIDVSSRTIAAAQFQRRRGSLPQLKASVVIDRPEGAGPIPTPDELARLEDTLLRKGFVGRRVVLALPHSKAVSAMLELPGGVAGPALDAIARNEFSRVQRRDMGAVEMAWWPLPAGGRNHEQTSALAVACPHSDADSLLSAYEHAGFEPAALDSRSWALARSCGPSFPEGEGVGVIIDAGWSAAWFVVLIDGVVVYERVLEELALTTAIKGLADRLGVSTADAERVLSWPDDHPGFARARDAVNDAADGLCAAVLREARASLTYAAHRYPKFHTLGTLLTGDGPGPRHLAARLFSQLESVAVPTLAAYANPAPQADGLMGAAGLALHPGDLT